LVLWKVNVSPQSGEPVGKVVKVADLGSTAIRHATLSWMAGSWLTAPGQRPTTVGSLSFSATQEAMAAPPHSPMKLGRDTWQPAFSPDGQRIAFAALHRGSKWAFGRCS